MTLHEFRDPIHNFVTLDSQERKVVDSRPFQRLRHIHQLALTHLVYPGATHKRFEHSLGVMELASRVYDVITNRDNMSNDIKNHFEEIQCKDQVRYWRRVVRMAALCHDVGHLPFSHAAEKDLLPDNWNHERITRRIIESSEMKKIWSSMKPPLEVTDIVKIALGAKEATDLTFSSWEAILSEVITGDAFGVDRIDYLLRDSYHTGVAYGKFDHYRLIDTLRILPSSYDESDTDCMPLLGIQEGGLHSAEALMLARYFMYIQVYFHPIRRIYDIHLMDFLREWLKNGQFSAQTNSHLRKTDNEVFAALQSVSRNRRGKGYKHAARIVERQHFKLLYSRNPNDVKINRNAGKAVFDKLSEQFGECRFRHDRYTARGGAPDFPVELRDGKIVSSLLISKTLNQLPVVSVDNVFVDRSVYNQVHDWLVQNRDRIICPNSQNEEN